MWGIAANGMAWEVRAIVFRKMIKELKDEDMNISSSGNASLEL
jgi:hypothetical protein